MNDLLWLRNKAFLWSQLDLAVQDQLLFLYKYSNLKQLKNPGTFQIPELANLAGLFSPLFQGLNNCTINFSPQSINIGVGYGEFVSSEMGEFDSIVTEMPMDNFD